MNSSSTAPLLTGLTYLDAYKDLAATAATNLNATMVRL